VSPLPYARRTQRRCGGRAAIRSSLAAPCAPQLVVVFDADMVAAPEFYVRVLAELADPQARASLYPNRRMRACMRPLAPGCRGAGVARSLPEDAAHGRSSLRALRLLAGRQRAAPLAPPTRLEHHTAGRHALQSALGQFKGAAG